MGKRQFFKKFNFVSESFGTGLQSRRGFSLMETIVAISVLLIVILGILGALRLSIRAVGRSGARVGAISLVNKRMEMLRNLKYEDIGVLGGIPSGDILAEEDVRLNDIDYTLKTFIQYVDDSADGTGEDDENGITADYKRARIEVSWSGRYETDPVIAVSDFMPKGIETITGGGTLTISVFDAQIQPISLANVHIINNETDPTIDINVQTNSAGKVTFPGSPSIGTYKVVVSKTGYSTAQTYDATAENPNPDPGHLTILEGKTTEGSFAIDKVSSLVVETLTSESYYLIGINFDIEGAKTIGKDSENEWIYKYSEEHNSGISGILEINDLEWDVYDISSLHTSANNYDISASSLPEPISIEPDTSNTLKLFLVPHAENTLLVTVENASQELLTSASVRLYETGYDEAIETAQTGQSFFTPLTPGTAYSLEVTKTGYQNYLLENVEIDGQTQIKVIMDSL